MAVSDPVNVLCHNIQPVCESKSNTFSTFSFSPSVTGYVIDTHTYFETNWKSVSLEVSSIKLCGRELVATNVSLSSVTVLKISPNLCLTDFFFYTNFYFLHISALTSSSPPQTEVVASSPTVILQWRFLTQNRNLTLAFSFPQPGF